MNEYGAPVDSAWEKPSGVPTHAMKAVPFLPSALNGGEWPASHPGHLNPSETAPGTH
jgi:hypothetical protein